MKRFLFLLIVFSFSMSAQAAPKSCSVAHQAAVRVCADDTMTGEALASCLVAAKEGKKACMNGDSADPGNTGGGGDPGPTPSSCEIDCQASYDGTAEACETSYDISVCAGDSWCESFLQVAKDSCLNNAESTLLSCMAGC